MVRIDEALRELAYFRQAPGQECARGDLLPDGEVAAPQFALEHVQIAFEQLGAATIAPQPVIDLSEVGVCRLLETRVPERAGDREGALAGLDRSATVSGQEEAIRAVDEHPSQALVVADTLRRHLRLAQMIQNPPVVPERHARLA